MSTSLVASLSLHLEFEKQAAEPLFRQLYSGLRAAILAGRLEGGTRLPPTRQLAEELEISRKTVVNAFEQLIAEGYLEGKVGSGTYVARVLPEEGCQSDFCKWGRQPKRKGIGSEHQKKRRQRWTKLLRSIGEN